MVVKHRAIYVEGRPSLRVVLSRMVVKPKAREATQADCLRVVLSRMVVKPVPLYCLLPEGFESSVISYGSQALFGKKNTA